ncbi:hypothetical protein INS49_008210 [Diaporthe citri]|uniref:uncharacterized protein n=1 Tax=Diaporthe citri TaxID=83186 RepID=UPI001C7E3BC3|nr:uncharacterized protein INS49_008210 [Diaporthe citri]KAG6363115.1 hypothetical protein INS49_008210 [Diaporthe citri]
MAALRETRVQPHGNKQDEVVQLADLDVIEPKLYVHMIEVFSLKPDADKQQILDNLTEGLSRTLAEYPILVGSLHFDNETKRVVVKRTPASSVALAIKEPGSDGASDIESFATLDKHDFPVHLLDAGKVLPSSVVGTFPVPAQEISTDGPAVCAFQVTFIEGGIILALAVTHQVCDGMGCEMLLTSWSRNSYAVFNGTANGTINTAAMPDRNLLSLKSTPVTSPEELKKLGDKFPTYKARDGPPAPPPADFEMPVVKTRIWHVPNSKLKELKALASATAQDGGGPSWVSTYDALLAILWRAIVRAKQPLLKPDAAAPSKAIHAVNARGRTDPPIPDNYIGVAVTLPQSPELAVTDVLSPDLGSALPLLARTVRAATNQVTPSYVADLIRWAGSSPDLRWVELDMHWVLGLDCMAFDWHTMKSYQVHDFGFGRPAALRWPHPQFEGFFFVLPTRTTKGNPDEAFLRVTATGDVIEDPAGDEDSSTARDRILRATRLVSSPSIRTDGNTSSVPSAERSVRTRQSTSLTGIELMDAPPSWHRSAPMLEYHVKYAHGFVFVFNMSSRETLELVKEMFDAVEHAAAALGLVGDGNGRGSTPVILIGNVDEHLRRREDDVKEGPADSKAQDRVPAASVRAEAAMLAESWGCELFEVDTGSGAAFSDGANEAFFAILRKIEEAKRPRRSGIAYGFSEKKAPERLLVRRTVGRILPGPLLKLFAK